MTPSRATTQEIRKAAGWLRSCRDQIEAAEYKLKLAISANDGPTIIQARRHLDAARNQRHAAAEDLAGWQSFKRRFVG